MKYSNKKYFYSLMFLFISCLIVSCTSEKDKIAYVLNARLLKEYKGTDDIKKSISKKLERNQFYLDSLKVVFRKLEESRLSNQEVQSRKYQIRESIERISSEEQQLTSEAEAQLWDQINKHVSSFGKENNYKLLIGAMGNGNLMYADSTIDVTSKVVEYMNKRYESGN